MIIGIGTVNFSKIQAKPAKNSNKISFTGNSGDTFTKSSKALTFGERSKDNSFLKNEKGKALAVKGETSLYGKCNFKKIKAHGTELFNTSHADLIESKYVTLFDRSTAKKVNAGISASIYTTRRIPYVISGRTVDFQPEKGGYIGKIEAGYRVSIGQHGSAGKVQCPEVEIFNDANAGDIKANRVEVRERATVDKIISEDTARIRQNSKVHSITAKNHVGLSGECEVGKVVLTGDNARVNINDNPQFDEIIFIKGNGRVILHKDWQGNYPEIDETKIKGGKIERTGKYANGDRSCRNIKHYGEFYTNF